MATSSPNRYRRRRKFNIDLSDHIAHQITLEDVNWADVILAMDHQNVQCLKELFPLEARGKPIQLLGAEITNETEIPDPHQKLVFAFRECFLMIRAAARLFIQRTTKMAAANESGGNSLPT